MASRVVLIPFKTEHSAEHLAATRGGEIESEYLQQLNSLEPLKNDPAMKPIYQNYMSMLNNRRNELTGWRKIARDDVVCADSPTLFNALSKLQDPEDTLYIRGHCDPGGTALESSDHKEQATVAQVVYILKNKLKFNFSGKVKIFACHSALDSITQGSFAYQLAEEMRDANWQSCTFYGYEQAMRTYPQGGHKLAADGQRAKEARCQIPL